MASVAISLRRCAPERVGERGEAAAFRVGQAQPAATEVGFEDTVFLDGDR